MLPWPIISKKMYALDQIQEDNVWSSGVGLALTGRNTNIYFSQSRDIGNEKLLRPLFRPRFIYACPKNSNPSRGPVPLTCEARSHIKMNFWCTCMFYWQWNKGGEGEGGRGGKGREEGEKWGHLPRFYFLWEGGGGLNGDKIGTDLGFKKQVNRGEQWLDHSFMIWF